MIDEAHLLEDCDALETLRLLSNFRSTAGPAFPLLLVGQMGLLSSVARRPTLDERLDVKTLVRGFTAEETAAYVACRLRLRGDGASCSPAKPSPSCTACRAVRPGGSTAWCELAMVVGFAEGRPAIDAEEIASVHRELVTVGSP